MRPVHLAALVLIASIWGASFMLMKVMLDEMSPLAVAWFRLAGGGAFIGAFLLVRRAGLPRGATQWRDVAVVALIGSTAPLLMIPWGQQFIPSNVGAVLNGAMPLWTAMLAIAFLPAERMTRWKAAGLALGFAGLAVVIGVDALDLRAGATHGQFVIVLASLGYAGSAVFTRRRLLGMNSTTLAASQTAIALVYVTPVLFLLGGGPPALGDLSGRVLLATLALGVLSQGVAITLYFWLLSNVEATQASLVTYLLPVTAIFWGWLVLAETPALSLIPGLALIIAGIVLVNRRPPALDSPEAAPIAVPPPEPAAASVPASAGPAGPAEAAAAGDRR